MLYYGFARFLPAYPIPGYQLAYSIRRSICKKLFLKMGGGTLIKRNAYFGDGHGILIGENSQIGLNAVLSTDVTLGDNVVMGPDVIIYSNSHEYADVNIPINQQGMKKSNPVTIGNNVWIGARVVILPGVTIGDNCNHRRKYCGDKICSGQLCSYRPCRTSCKDKNITTHQREDKYASFGKSISDYQ